LFTGTFAPKLTLISRPGLFKLIQRSNKPEAKEFDRCGRSAILGIGAHSRREKPPSAN
jgi:BRO family, N-terminal domain